MNETRGVAVGFYGVKKIFAKERDLLTVLDNMTLQIEENELTCIVGPSGCGKSTLLNLVAGLSPIDGGRVEFRGRLVTSVNTNIGYITQDSNLLPWFTVLENILLPLEIRKVGNTSAQRRSLALEWIAQVGLDGFEHHYPHQLSGGMQKRVSIARTLVYDPDVILMDEPFGPLDAITKMVLQNLLLRLWQERQKTIIYVTHDLTEAITLGDRVVIMTKRPGAVKAVLPVAMARPRDAFSLSETPEYAAIHRQFWELMRSEVIELDADLPNQPDDVLHIETVRELSAPNQAARRSRGGSEQTILIVGRILLVVAILALWQFADDRLVPDFVISSPVHVAAQLAEDLQRRAIWNDIATTSEEWVMGYVLGAVVGIVLGFLLGLNWIVRGIFEPVISTVNAIPKVALAPLFLIAMGLGPASKVAIAAMMVALLMFYNTLGGILVAPRPLIDVLRVIGARRGTIVRKVLFPFLSTYIIAGLKSSVPLAIVGVIVGEFIGADAGIGFHIRQSTDLFDSAGLFSGVLILIVLTLLGNGLVQLLERRLLRWQR